MRKQYIHFNDLPIKAYFSRNGNEWMKRSTRTAEIVKPEEYSGTWFYFGERELCIVGLHDRIATN